LVIGIVFLMLSAAVGAMTWWYLRVLDRRLAAGRSGRKTAPANGGRAGGSLAPQRKRGKEIPIQELWGVEDIRGGVIISNDCWYRMLLKIGPIDYHIMNEDEQYSIESVLMSSALAISFPVQLFSTTELVDTKNCAQAIRSFIEHEGGQNLPVTMIEYGVHMYAFLTSMMQNRSVHNRPRYIAVSYHTPDGFAKAREELLRRARIITNNLRGAKINADLLSSEQVLDVLFRFCNRGRVLQPSAAVNEGAMDLYTTGRRGIHADLFPGGPEGERQTV
jgi:hypothetical protein